MALTTLPKFADLLTVNVAPLAEFEIQAIQPMTSNYSTQIVFGSSASQTVNATSSKPFVVGMGGNDTLYGDDAENILVGDDFAAEYIDYIFDDMGRLPPYDATVKGNDVLYGGGASDFIITDGGNDSVYGESGRDEFVATAEKVGSSVYYGGDDSAILTFQDLFDLGFSKVIAKDLIFDSAHGIDYVGFDDLKLAGTSGDDIFDFSGTILQFFGTSFPSDPFPVIDMGAGNDRFTGSANKESDGVNVFGDSGNDTLNGTSDDDTLDGGSGTDSLVGGSGADLYVVDSVTDIAIETKPGVSSDNPGDTVQTTLAQYTLLKNFEDLIYTGTAAFTGTGNSAANSMNGGTKADVLNGAGGSDKIFGGLGADTLIGGGGADIFVFDTAPGSGNFDLLSNFNVVDDTIWLAKNGAGLFNAFDGGALSADKFRIYGSGPVDSNDRILYDSATGKIFYDADGSGAGAKLLFATVTVGTALTAADFAVI